MMHMESCGLILKGEREKLMLFKFIKIFVEDCSKH